MASVNIRISHQYNLMIPQLCFVKIFANACSQRGYYRCKLFITIDFVRSGFFDVEHFSE
jgi:hypothetical protein